MLFRLLIFTLFLTAMNTFAQTPQIETGVPQTLAKWRAANYSDVRYKLNLTLEKMSPTLKGTIEISLKNNADQIVLDWRKLRGREDLSRVENVFVNGKAAKFEEINEHLVFKEGVIKGENVIKLDFSSPILTSGGAITRYVDKEDGAEYVYSLFVPSDASTAFPVFDQPDLKARFTLTAQTPSDWNFVTNNSYQVWRQKDITYFPAVRTRTRIFQRRGRFGADVPRRLAIERHRFASFRSSVHAAVFGGGCRRAASRCRRRPVCEHSRRFVV